MIINLEAPSKRSEDRSREVALVRIVLIVVALFVFFEATYNLGLINSSKYNENNNNDRAYSDKVAKILEESKETPIEELPETAEDFSEGFGEVEKIEKPSFDLSKIKSYVTSYPGSRITEEYLNILAVKCDKSETLATIIAMSVSETSMGRNTTNRTNFWGWFVGGNKAHDPETYDEMASQICGGISKYYSGLTTLGSVGIYDFGELIKVKPALAQLVITYTGNDKPYSWFSNFMLTIKDLM